MGPRGKTATSTRITTSATTTIEDEDIIETNAATQSTKSSFIPTPGPFKRPRPAFPRIGSRRPKPTTIQQEEATEPTIVDEDSTAPAQKSVSTLRRIPIIESN